jgi:peptidoglycan hydrolase-like protein with peptidoglycan-binding domain
MSPRLERRERGHRPPDTARAPAHPGAEHPLLALQRGAGNAAMGRWLARLVQDRKATHPTLSLHHGPAAEIKHLQERLNQDGADPALVPDGDFGKLTKAAVIAFQERHGLKGDGSVGLRTWGLLDELDLRGIHGPRRTSLDDAKPVSQQTHDDIEKLLHPSKPGKPPMTGTGPGGEYETQMLDALDKLYERRAQALVPAAKVDMNHANRVSDIGQKEVEKVFGADIALASRQPTGDWHPGSSRMGLADASARQVDQQDMLGWMDVFMNMKGRPPGNVAETHNYDHRRAEDRKESDRVRDLWLNTHNGRQRLTEIIRGWPAEAATGTVFLQLRDKAYQDQVGLWDLFLTMVHEFLHLVTHPNYGETAEAIGGVARGILIEGMDDHFARQVWPGVLRRAGTDPTLRAAIEGPFFTASVNPADYDAGGPFFPRLSAHHYPSMSDADKIAGQAGEPNARAAFFMGHVEALGLGAGTAAEHKLDGLANWTAAGGVPDEYPVPAAGETVQDVKTKTGARSVAGPDGAAVSDPAHRFPGGAKLKVMGLRWHVAIKQDTRGQIAVQHGIKQEALERANGLAADKPSAPVAAGTLLMIPLS